MTTQTRNEAAEWLAFLLGHPAKAEERALLDDALAAERRATVERLLTDARYAASGNTISLSALQELGRRLDEEAAR